MIKKDILIVEDNEVLGKNLREAFEDRGFNARHVTNRRDALAISHPPDVAILDMNLGEEKTGAEVGQELRLKFKSKSPEFIIYSAYDDQKYLHSAIRLGAATYLEKATRDYRTVITHARILAIRGVIRKSIPSIRSLVKMCITVPEAVETVTKQILTPELHECLGAKFFVLFSHKGEHHCIDNNMGLKEDDPAYALIENIAHDLISTDYLDLSNLPPDWSSLHHTLEIPPFNDQLKNTLLMNLYSGDDISLSLGIKNESVPIGSLEENADELARVIGRHFRSELIESLFSTTHILAEQEISKRRLLGMAGSFCINLAEIHKNLYREAKNRGEVPPGSVVLPEIPRLGNELRTVGTQIEASIEKSQIQDRVNLQNIIEQAKKELACMYALEDDSIENKGLSEVEGNYPSLLIAVKRILSWMIRRFPKCEERIPKITVWEELSSDKNLRIFFKDNSKRLPSLLLKDIFQPFSAANSQEELQFEESIGLFTAKTLIEGQNSGLLLERSWSLGDRLGHLFELQLPRPDRTTNRTEQTQQKIGSTQNPERGQA